MNCPNCDECMEEGEVSVDGMGGTIYWVPKTYFEKHIFKTSQLLGTIKKDGGVVISKQTSSISETLYAFHCPKCKKIIIDYE